MGDATTAWHVRILGGLRRTGAWRMRPRTVLVTLIGGTHLDLRQAELPPAGEVTLILVTLVGGVDLLVGPELHVEVSGLTLLGGHAVEAGAPGATRTLRIRRFGLVGGVRVRRG